MSDNKIKLLFIDIETSPIIGYTWKTWDTSVLKVIEPSKIISVSWKWFSEETTYVKTIADYTGYKANKVEDKKLVTEIWKLLDEADLVCAHHGDNFDLKKLNARFIYHGLSAPSFYKSIDTKKAASKYFKFDSNSLNNLGVYLGCGTKINNGGFDLWVRCMAGDQEAWKAMADYNKQDTVLLEKVYLKLRPFMEDHPNLNAITSNAELACRSCGSHSIQKRGWSFTKTTKRQRYQCNDCGSWSSGGYQKIKSVLS